MIGKYSATELSPGLGFIMQVSCAVQETVVFVVLLLQDAQCVST